MGAVFIFTYSSSSQLWNHVQTVYPQNDTLASIYYQNFGVSVSISGNVLLASAEIVNMQLFVRADSSSPFVFKTMLSGIIDSNGNGVLAYPMFILSSGYALVLSGNYSSGNFSLGAYTCNSTTGQLAFSSTLLIEYFPISLPYSAWGNRVLIPFGFYDSFLVFEYSPSVGWNNTAFYNVQDGSVYGSGIWNNTVSMAYLNSNGGTNSVFEAAVYYKDLASGGWLLTKTSPLQLISGKNSYCYYGTVTNNTLVLSCTIDKNPVPINGFVLLDTNCAINPKAFASLDNPTVIAIASVAFAVIIIFMCLFGCLLFGIVIFFFSRFKSGSGAGRKSIVEDKQRMTEGQETDSGEVYN